jgi:hypothetical protein
VLVDKTDRLADQSLDFRRAGQGLRRTMQWQQIKMYLIGGGIALLVLIIFIIIIKS